MEQEKKQEKRKVKISLLAFGGGGGHIAQDVHLLLKAVNLDRVKLQIYAFNTDLEDLEDLPEGISQVPIGMKLTGGYGAGSNPEIGLQAAEASSEAITAAMADSDIVIFLSCLGGGTGTGSIQYAVRKFSDHIKDQRSKPLFEQKAGFVIVTKPFKREGLIVETRAEEALNNLHECRVPIFVIPNDRFLSEESDSNRRLSEMFQDGNVPVAQMIGRMVRAIGKRHTIRNIDRNDIVGNLILEANSTTEGYYSVGYGSGDNRIKDALSQISKNNFLETSLECCRKLIVSVDCSNPTENDWREILTFFEDNRYHEKVELRYGISDDLIPMEFEKELDPQVVIFVMGVEYMRSAKDKDANFFGQSGVSLNSFKVPPPASKDQFVQQINGNGNIPTRKISVETVYQTLDDIVASQEGKK